MLNEWDSTPWYRQFWPWFIMALPASVVIASFVTLYIAISHNDALVKDNYYQEGLAINTDLGEEKRAKSLGLNAKIHIDRQRKTIGVQLASTQSLPVASILLLKFIHPFDAQFDMEIPLQRQGKSSTGQQQYQQTYHEIKSLNWNLEITPLYIEANTTRQAQWKIKMRFNPSTAAFTADSP